MVAAVTTSASAGFFGRLGACSPAGCLPCEPAGVVAGDCGAEFAAPVACAPAFATGCGEAACFSKCGPNFGERVRARFAGFRARLAACGSNFGGCGCGCGCGAGVVAECAVPAACEVVAEEIAAPAEIGRAHV